ncbi:glycosyltransferase family 2 protein [Mangrovimonas sp. ST2L15]|uniref:glycosyltransferase family 2 protein n=1 Tax=Mangrovimonas sp. ST2L15 TaxID=1645916 RepID=UPI0006B693E1|nr:glycosyltransferase family 2 protein [Mangrovimonas sp. ST2L15]
MTLAVAILNWNGKDLLQQFLPSVVAHSPKADIYVIDNASSDDSVAWVEKNFPIVKVIVNKENGGYAKGYNDGLSQINADVFCLLNSDVEVTPNWLDPIVEEFNTYPMSALIQPKILSYHDKDHFEYAGAAGGFIDKLGYPFCRGRIFDTVEKDLGQYNERSPIFWASGACLFIKSDTFHKLGGFDESFFAHMEEIDLCWRAFNQNLKTIYLPSSIIYHVGGATLKNTNPRKTYLNFRNSLFTLTKNAYGPIWALIFMRLVLDGVAGIKFLLELKPQHTVSILKAHLSFYSKLPYLISKRKQQSLSKEYFYTNSIVWTYYVRKCQTFDRLHKC